MSQHGAVMQHSLADYRSSVYTILLQWEFLKRRELYFECKGTLYSPKTVIALTEEWREELEHLYRSKGWKLPERASQGPRKRIIERVSWDMLGTTCMLSAAVQVPSVDRVFHYRQKPSWQMQPGCNSTCCYLAAIASSCMCMCQL